ncbi:winged helix-turn-helix domain-containing protein [Thermoflexus hugenholtzii]
MVFDLSNPYTRYLRSHRHLVGRRRILREILEGILRNSQEPPESCSIRGPRAIGKTTLLRFLQEMTQTPGLLASYGLDPGLAQERLRCVYYVDLYQVSGSQVAEQVMEQMGETWTGNPWEALSHLPALPRRVLLLDHCDEALQTMEPAHARRLRELTAHHALIIATERDPADLMPRREVLSPLVQVLRPYRLGLLERKEAEELFRQPAREVGIELEPEVVDFFIRVLGRHPYLLLLGGEALFNWLQDPERRSRLCTDPWLQEEARFRIRMHPAVQDFLDYIWKGLSEEERNALGRVLEGQPILPRQRLRLERAALIESSEEGLRVFSELFAEEARERLQAPQPPRLEEQLPPLSGLEGQLLEYLRARPGHACTYTELVHALWGPQAKVEEKKRALDALIYRVRQRIREATGSRWEYIRNIRGKGYVFTPPPYPR